MVNVFIIHSGKDYEYVKRTVEPYLMGKIDEDGKEVCLENNANILTLKSGEKTHWKKGALKKIKMAQIIVIVVGEDAIDKKKTDTMGWEVKRL